MNTRAATSTSSYGSVSSYAIRLGFSLMLIIGPLAAVMGGFVPPQVRLHAMVVLCVGHLLMQLVWFLHPGTRKEDRANTVNFVCTGLAMAIILGVSL